MAVQIDIWIRSCFNIETIFHIVYAFFVLGPVVSEADELFSG